MLCIAVTDLCCLFRHKQGGCKEGIDEVDEEGEDRLNVTNNERSVSP
jgi:hypothetical protein